MRSKKHLDFGGLAMDVGRTIDDALSRSEALAQKKLTAGPSAAGKEPADMPATQSEEFAGQGGKTPSQPRRSKRLNAKNSESSRSVPKKDPWVNATFKVRESKRERLHRLHLTRQLEGLTPYTKQDFLDEAIDLVLERYEKRSKQAESSG